MNKQISLIKYNYARACKMHTCSSSGFWSCEHCVKHGWAVPSLLDATPPPVEVGRRPLGGGGGGHWRGGFREGRWGGGFREGRWGGGVQGGAMGGGGVGRVGWGGGPGGAIWGSGGGGIGSRYLPLPSLMGES